MHLSRCRSWSWGRLAFGCLWSLVGALAVLVGEWGAGAGGAGDVE